MEIPSGYVKIAMEKNTMLKIYEMSMVIFNSYFDITRGYKSYKTWFMDVYGEVAVLRD